MASVELGIPEVPEVSPVGIRGHNHTRARFPFHARKDVLVRKPASLCHPPARSMRRALSPLDLAENAFGFVAFSGAIRFSVEVVEDLVLVDVDSMVSQRMLWVCSASAAESRRAASIPSQRCASESLKSSTKAKRIELQRRHSERSSRGSRILGRFATLPLNKFGKTLLGCQVRANSGYWIRAVGGSLLSKNAVDSA